MSIKNCKLDNLACLSSQIEVLLLLSVSADANSRSVLDVILLEKSNHLHVLVNDICRYKYTAEMQHGNNLLDKPTATRAQVGAPKTNAIAFRIQLARENLGLSEADLARKLNTYSDHISDWECGITEPPASRIIPLANALKCDPLWLLTGEITPQASSDNVAQQHHRASQQAGGVSREVLQQ